MNLATKTIGEKRRKSKGTGLSLCHLPQDLQQCQCICYTNFEIQKKILQKDLYSSISPLQYISLEFIRNIHYFSNASNSSHDSSIHNNHAHTKTGHTTALFSIHTHENLCIIPTQSLHAELVHKLGFQYKSFTKNATMQQREPAAQIHRSHHIQQL